MDVQLIIVSHPNTGETLRFCLTKVNNIAALLVSQRGWPVGCSLSVDGMDIEF
jgi:hypothetical protein